MTTQNLLVELFIEELPPKVLQKLGDAFGSVLLAQLQAQGLAAAGAQLTAYASPRRLAAHITAVAPQAADRAQSHKLMPVAVGLDAAGNATPALLKKLAAVGADVSDPARAVAALQRAPDGKADALFHHSTARGATLAEGLQKALDEALAKLPIPKVMRYQLAAGCDMPGWSSVSFVRPAHGLVALHGSSVVPVTALGLHAGNATHGHRFEASVDPVVLHSADSYAAQLRDEGAVIASFTERRAEIARQLQAAAAKVGEGARAIDDPALLDEVTALVERPNVLVCEFEKEFLGVPQECLILTMKANQKYFPLLDAAGALSNQFLVVSNISPQDASAVIEGNERVVRPRLQDARFFFDQDRKKKLSDRVEGLDKVVYHNKLGTQGERVQRVRAIASAIGQQLGGERLADSADTAARLAKADLLTDMVGEFPELQGVMGRYYALNDGLPPEVADAIEDHYKPRIAGHELPRGEVGNHLAFGQQGRLVGVGGGDVDVAAAHEAVALGGAAGLDVEHAARHDVGAVEHRELVRRAHEGGVTVAPAHHLGNRQGLEGVLDDAGEHVGKLRAGHGAGVEQGFGLAVHAALEAGHGRQRNALAFELLGESRGRLTVGAERDGNRHDLLGHILGRGFGQHVGHAYRQAARGGKPAEITLGSRQAAGAQAGNNGIRKSHAELRQGLGGQLFGEQFNEQGRAGHHAASFLSIGKPRASREL